MTNTDAIIRVSAFVLHLAIYSFKYLILFTPGNTLKKIFCEDYLSSQKLWVSCDCHRAYFLIQNQPEHFYGDKGGVIFRVDPQT